MKMNVCLDANVARLVHIDWAYKLDKMVEQGFDRTDNSSQTPMDISPLMGHEDCNLGKWLYGKALRYYNDSRVVWPLSDIHQRFHRVAQHMLQDREQLMTMGPKKLEQEGRELNEHIQQLLEEIHQLSREIVYLLTSMELDILESDVPSVISNPWAALKHMMAGSDSEHSEINEKMHVFQDMSDEYLDDGSEQWHKKYIEKINETRLAHVEWVMDLQNAFRNYGRTVKLQPAEQCDLGLWIQNEGHEFLSKHTEVAGLDDLHKEFHQAANDTVYNLRAGRFRGSEESYHQALDLSKDIVFMLTKVEYLYEGPDNLARRMGGVQLDDDFERPETV